ncbi:unnamed protein product [Acanthoscelides obtectus]|uniref:t-SNARE coiled-coil homology domain-containing protein n=2 Tax=Acanthoscelides obtectus TaxID=200917 RepID=A0A9P0M796_ACAOB|nr:unnamed protein product [Acanthoscelides obtectus]CAK1625730.1 Syntaxin-1A homolog [Acanthoscelides obtectus]
MTKDRLGELLKAQKNSKKDVELDVEQENNNEGGKSDLKKTFERAEVISQWLQGIEKNVEAIKEYESRINDLRYNQTDLNEKIDTLFQNNTSICHKINAKLKEIDEELKQTAEDSAEGRIKAIQYNTLKTRYIETFKSNNNALENYRNVQKANLDAQLRAKGIRMTDEELVHLLEENTDMQLFTDNIIADSIEAKRQLRDIEERHQQLLKIERMLMEIRDLFLQMAILVDTQQELIDRVEYQAQAARDFVAKTPKILQDASKKKRNYLKCKIYMGITILILVVILLIMLLK